VYRPLKLMAARDGGQPKLGSLACTSDRGVQTFRSRQVLSSVDSRSPAATLRLRRRLERDAVELRAPRHRDRADRRIVIAQIAAW
jgi:hypothetical protein